MMAERAAAAEAMFNSLSSEQQGELRALFDQMMQNMELNFSMNRLVSNLRQATPDIDWNRAHRMRGQDGSPFADAASVAEQLGELKGLEEFLGQSHAAQGLPEVDVEAVRRNLGDDAARHVRAPPARPAGTERPGLHRPHLEPPQAERSKGIRKIGQIALRDLFKQLRDSPTLGGHPVATLARGGDREETSKPWEPGEAVALHLPRTLRNALLRQGPGTPVRLHPDDFEVEEYEATRRSATVFAIDLSLSMAMRGNLRARQEDGPRADPAHLARSFPATSSPSWALARRAQELKIEDIPALTIDYNYGTNLQHALPSVAICCATSEGSARSWWSPTASPRPTSPVRASPSFRGLRCTKPWKRRWPKCCAARRRASPSTPSPWTSSAVSSPSSSRSPG